MSRTFVERTRHALGELVSRQLADLRLAVMMLDGLELKGRMMIVALGDHHRGRQDPARPVGRVDRERDRRDGFLTVITATITSTFIEQARGRTQASATDELAAKLDQIIERLDLIAGGCGDVTRHDRPTD